MVQEKRLFSLSLRFFYRVLVFWSLDADNSIPPSLLDEFHPALQRHLLLLDLIVLVTDLPFGLDLFAPVLRYHSAVHLVNFYGLLACREATHLLNL